MPSCHTWVLIGTSLSSVKLCGIGEVACCHVPTNKFSFTPSLCSPFSSLPMLMNPSHLFFFFSGFVFCVPAFGSYKFLSMQVNTHKLAKPFPQGFACFAIKPPAALRRTSDIFWVDLLTGDKANTPVINKVRYFKETAIFNSSILYNSLS